MTLNQAFEQLIQTPKYKEKAKAKDSEGGKYRVWMARYKQGVLKPGVITEILIAHGYEIKANKVTKKNNL